ncbi:uncharacterized protein [Coffea arabica]|uniref:Uncharacterized protein n=1 Tax=Coffea arabica TaxID=13443 RepID=A0A6P6VIH3_COFAR|nr:uncharacterized protein LOC113724013 [Coffea arabica]
MKTSNRQVSPETTTSLIRMKSTHVADKTVSKVAVLPSLIPCIYDLMALQQSLLLYPPKPYLQPYGNKDMETTKLTAHQESMDIWSWICELPDSEDWFAESTSLSYQLTSSKPISNSTQTSIQLRAERTFEPNSEVSLTFSVVFQKYSDSTEAEASTATLWVSDKCHLAQDKPFLPLVLQLLQEIISRSPNAHDSTCPRSQLQKLKPEPIAWILDSHSPESFSSFFHLIFLARLFWICVFDAPSEVGSLYFHSLLAPNLGAFSCKQAPVLRTFFVSVGTDVELCLMRAFGYMLAKSLIFRQVGGLEAGLKALAPSASHRLGFSYATESHGLWILKGYTPVTAMDCATSNRNPNMHQFPVIEPKESALRYSLGHQQLEAVIQLEYKVEFCDAFIRVHALVDNIRLHVVKLGFKSKESGDDDDVLRNERHFPSRVRVWVGPEIGASYVGGLSLGRSTGNVEREVEIQKIFKGSSGEEITTPKVMGVARMATRTKMKNWRWDQDVEGNAGIFDGMLCDNTTGKEVATWKPSTGGRENDLAVNSFMRRNRAFTKSGGVVFAGEECCGGNGGVGWRLNKEMEGSVLKWRIGGQVWLTYWPNDVKSSYYETKCVEWCDEVDLPLIPGKYS